MRLISRGQPIPAGWPEDLYDIEGGIKCPTCGALLAGGPRFHRYRICDECGRYVAVSARKRIDMLVDAGSFRETDSALASGDPLRFADEHPYRDRLREMRDATGLSDALMTGRAALHGVEIVIAVLDFGFLGGSMGVVVGEKLARAAEIALKERRPLVTVVASGGARMQEGMLSLLQMAKTASAVQRLHTAGVPYVSILTHPTTGGVFASFANLGDVIVAEPGALIGFAGPRVAEQFLGRPLPKGSHTAEFLAAHGLIDGVIERPNLRRYLGDLLTVLTGRAPRHDHEERPEAEEPESEGSAWDTVLDARNPDRPTTLFYIAQMTDGFIELHGDRSSGEDPAMVAGFGWLEDRPVAVVGIERGVGKETERRRGGRPLPEGYRKAQRVMRLAARFGLPVVSLVDTPGAYPGIESEERGLAAEIAQSLALMSDLPVPTVAAITGEGGSGGALALALADRVLMLERAIYSVIAPEGAAAILYHDASRAPEVAERLKLTAVDVLDAGIVDAIVSEPAGGAQADAVLAAEKLKQAIAAALAELAGVKRDRLLERRFQRYRAIGAKYVESAPRSGN